MTELRLTLTDEERGYLEELLDREMKDTRIEERRTRAPEYRKGIIHQEDLIAALLEKLRATPR